MTITGHCTHKIIHIDMDAFFASIEQRDNPQYREKPLIVGGKPEGRGVVATCSYEARRFGIHSAMSCKRAYTLCPDAIFIPPRHAYYRKISSEIMALFQDVTELVEPLSLDEAFLDVTCNSLGESSATHIANILRQRIFSTTGLTASAGISYNKFLSKVASDINKPNGITIIPPQNAQQFIATLPIGNFFGVGKVTEKKRHSLGIINGADLYKWGHSELLYHFGKAGDFFYNIVRGIDTRVIQPARQRKSIGSEVTLEHDTIKDKDIIIILNNLCSKVGHMLQKKATSGYRLTLKVRFSDFTTVTRTVTKQMPIYNTHTICELLPQLLAAVDFCDKHIRLLGITVSKLQTHHKARQLTLPFMDQESQPISLSLTL